MGLDLLFGTAASPGWELRPVGNDHAGVVFWDHGADGDLDTCSNIRSDEGKKGTKQGDGRRVNEFNLSEMIVPAVFSL